MWMRGPGEGYRAAKASVLALEPTAVCKKEVRGGMDCFMVYLKGKEFVADSNSRDAWNKALSKIKEADEKSLHRHV